MELFKFLVTRQLSGYAGDLYINVNSTTEFYTLYNGIVNGSINEVNGHTPTVDVAGLKVGFKVIDNLINRTFDVHIKNNLRTAANPKGDGLRLTLTDYIKFLKTTPSQVLIIFMKFEGTSCSLYVRSECIYKYILEKHTTEDVYRIIMDEVPDNYAYLEQISVNANSDLERFHILNTGDASLQWQGKNFNSYRAPERFQKKYIGIPFNADLEADSFNDIEEVI